MSVYVENIRLTNKILALLGNMVTYWLSYKMKG